jgi:predicted nucleotidyltransferase
VETLPVKSDEKWAKAVNAALSTLKSYFGDRLTDVILFGSYARGDQDAESDVDLLAVTNGPAGGDRDFIVELEADTVLEYGVVLSIHLINPSAAPTVEMEPFVINARREGTKVL